MALTNRQLAASAFLQARRLLFQDATRRVRTRKRPTPQRPPAGAQLLYLREIFKIQRTLEETIREIVFRALPELVTLGRIERPDGGERFDAPPSEFITRVMEGIRFSLGEEFTPTNLNMLTSGVGQSVDIHQKKQFDRNIKQVIGIPISAAEPWMVDLMAAFRTENVSLIKSLVGNQLDQIEQLLIRGQRRGLQVDVLREQIQDRFKVSRSKARLLARDQTNKLNGELAQLRQQSIGVKQYIWRTSGDDRVRETHEDLEGTTQSWDNAPDVGGGRRAHPGEDFQCRCYAEPILTPITESLTVQPPQPVIPASVQRQAQIADRAARRAAARASP